MADRALVRLGDLTPEKRILRYTDLDDPTGIAFAVQHVRAGEDWERSSEGKEYAVLVLSGRGVISAGRTLLSFDRGSWLDEGPTVLHVGAGSSVGIRAEADSEIAVIMVENPAPFETRAFRPEDVRSERRGEGKLDDTCTRIVRTVFDRDNAPPESRLVLGEVVTLPGRWSSYPPHHHPQPEIYYYRFDRPDGFGYAGLGEEVFKVREHDLVRIAGGMDHPQVAAPGYTMYYLWAVRHLPGRPYTGFEFAAEHAWLWK